MRAPEPGVFAAPDRVAITAPPPVLAVQGIRRSFGAGEARVDALMDVDLAIAPGEFCALCGPSGSGKSTLLNILGLLDRPDAGTISLAGTQLDLNDEAAARQLRRESFGFVFQNFNLIPTLNALENVEVALFHDRAPRKDRRRRAEAMLETVGLGARMGHRPNQLSGGQQQRVAMARALVRAPRIVIADEPTANLDAATAFGLMDLMESLRRSTGTSFICSTHDNRLMDRFSRVVTLEDGRITP